MVYNFKATAKMLDIEPSKVMYGLSYVGCLSDAEILGVISYFKENKCYIDFIDVAKLLGEDGGLKPDKPKTTAILMSLMCCGYIECIQE